MRLAVFSFLCLFLAPILTIAQVHDRENTPSWKVTIAGCTDSITVDAILSAGKLECSHKAFEIIDFTLATGGDCLTEGLYTEVKCPSAAFSATARKLIGYLRPGKHLFVSNVRLRNRAGQVLLIRFQAFQIRAGK